MTIGIVDVGIGNIGSLRQALFGVGWDPILVSKPEDFSEITHLLLPGVGAFAAAMGKFSQTGLVETIRAFADSGRPIMGICLGMQLLATVGTEGGDAEGLGLVPGRVLAIGAKRGLRIPHVGWNEAHQMRPHPVLKGIRDDVDFYFVHSYRFLTDEAEHILAKTEYGDRFASIIGRDNVVGVQFHPEKSQSNGLRILDNFCLWNGRC